jgi:hypothetical protein
MAQQPLVGQGLLIIEASRSHSDTTLGRTPLDECTARRTDLYLHNTHKIQASIPPAGFGPGIPASERPQTHALDRAAIRIGIRVNYPGDKTKKDEMVVACAFTSAEERCIRECWGNLKERDHLENLDVDGRTMFK